MPPASPATPPRDPGAPDGGFVALEGPAPEDAPLDLVGLEPPTAWDAFVARLTSDRRTRVAMGVAGGLVALAGAWVLLRPEPPRAEDVVPLAAPLTVDAGAAGTGTAGAGAAPAPGGSAPIPAASSSTTTVRLLVHAAGAVQAPGVYELGPGARVADLVAAAGGGRADADLDRLNLAEPLLDGTRVYVPAVAEEVAGPLVVAPGGVSPGAVGEGTASPDAVGTGGLVDLNQATGAELEALPGIGPATAQAILDHRQANGPFRAIDDLLAVRGIGDAKLAALRDLVTVGAP